MCVVCLLAYVGVSARRGAAGLCGLRQGEYAITQANGAAKGVALQKEEEPQQQQQQEEEMKGLVVDHWDDDTPKGTDWRYWLCCKSPGRIV